MNIYKAFQACVAFFAFASDARRLYGPEGTEFQVNNHTAGSQVGPSIASLTDGGFFVAWCDVTRHEIYGQRYTKGGEKKEKEFQVSTYTVFGDPGIPVVTDLTNGGFVIAWIDRDASAVLSIYAKQYLAT